MTKSKYLNRWLWKWHIIAGLITVPVMILLSITGIIYLFKADYEDAIYNEVKVVEQQGERLSYEQLLVSAQVASDKKISKLVLPKTETEAIQFVSGQRAQTRTIYVNPYTGTITGEIVAANTLMMTIRKLHGELLLGKGGTLFVELVASWFVVLIITGLYVWWPAKDFKLRGFFTIRTKNGRRLFYRDLHAVLGFWLSLFMLIILAGAMPWTDVFGSQLKWVQKQTDTGYPTTWRNSRGLQSDISSTAHSLSIDEMVAVAILQNLEGQTTLTLPPKTINVFTVSNKSRLLRDQYVRHFDQYSGELVRAHDWGDVGILMDARQVAMRLHQGEYGSLSWWTVLIVSLLFTISSAAGLISYLIRKPVGRWGIPEVPEKWQLSSALVGIVLGLGVLFPMFGGSLVLLFLLDITKNRVSKKLIRAI
ncbi:MAG: PepSY-associated TM helix domain-containing protein [Kordiimonas sp.]